MAAALKQMSICWRSPAIGIGVVFLLWIISPQISAQNRIRSTVTLNNNVTYEGEAVEVLGYSTMAVPPKSGKTWFVDDGLRRVFVHSSQLANMPVPVKFPSVEFSIWQDAVDKPPVNGLLRGVYDFNEFGHRVIAVKRPNKPVTNYVQGITKIAPTYVEVSTLKRVSPKDSFRMSLGLGAVPADTLYKILHNQIKRADSPFEYESIFSFYLRAQKYAEALAELDLIERKFPERKEDCESFRRRVRQSQARQVIEEIKRRIDYGQTAVAREMGNMMNTDGVSPQSLEELQELMDGIDKGREDLAKVRSSIVELVKRFQNGKAPAADSALLGMFLAELESELSTSNAARLDSYFVQANDATQTDEQKVALAISGWIVGSNSATPNYATARSMFAVRELIKSYLRSGNEGERRTILRKLREDFEAGTPEFVAAMLAQMKPLEHESATEGYTGEKPIEFNVVIPGPKAKPADQIFRVLVHLPIQYDPYRPYPLLISLPEDGMSVENQVNMFTNRYIEGAGGRVGIASRNGVIVASVQWPQPGRNGPAYSSTEHAAVLGAMRACFRKFAVDTDRVFLHGHEAGASLVYDIGLAHPEHFAGLIPVGGKIEKFAKIHAKDRNGQLAVRAVIGEGDKVNELANGSTWNTWLSSNRYVDLNLIQYKGRLNEKFPDDLKMMFEWMQFQRRTRPDFSGFEFAAECARPWDNYYWFMQLHGFPLANTTWPLLFKMPLERKSLRLEGELKPQATDANRFKLNPSRAGTGMTLWLSPDFFDFSKSIKITGRGKSFQGKIRASTGTILEDVRKRADRLHPYWARLDCNAAKWSVVE